VGLINQILTTPRQAPSSVGGLTGGGSGIAGVASNAEGKGIHIINERTKYKEWEFVYDLKKDKSVLAAAALQQQQLGRTSTGLGTPATGLGTPSPTAIPTPTPVPAPSPIH